MYKRQAAAGALHVQLGGTHMYFGKPIEKPTIGDDDFSIAITDIGDVYKRQDKQR